MLTTTKDNATRPCEVCAGAGATVLYQQKFERFDGGLLDGYDVVACDGCGFTFAENIPCQEAFDAYYRDLSKYENANTEGRVSAYKVAAYSRIVDAAAPCLPSQAARILDIGCATGELLRSFRNAGFLNVEGIDPSASCVRTATELYGLSARQGSLNNAKLPQRAFDLIVLSSVLEHIRDLRASLRLVRDLLKGDGMLFVDVPDVARFADFGGAGFQEFSVEHINYFSECSLTNLMHRNGFLRIVVCQEIQELAETTGATLFGLFKRHDGDAPAIERDMVSAGAIKAYVEHSRATDAGVIEKVDRLAANREPMVVWGVGTHTQRLMATTSLADANIVAFVDSDPHYHGKTLKGIPIIAPAALRGRSEPVLISSQTCQAEIARQIRESLKLDNELLLLY